MSSRLANLCKITTCHGVLDLYESKKLLAKLFWLAVMLAALGAIIYYQQGLITTYLSVPTVTAISSVQVDSHPFPRVTVCNENIFSRSRFERQWSQTQLPYIYNDAPTFLGYLCLANQMFPHYSFKLGFYNATQETQYQVLLRQMNTTDFLKASSYSCGDFFPQYGDCQFAMSNFDCCNGSQTLLTDLGNCIEISPQFVQQLVGPQYGMQLILTYNSSDAVMFPLNPNRKTGFQLSIGDYMNFGDFSRVNVGPNQAALVKMTLTKYITDPLITPCVTKNLPLAYGINGRNSDALCKQECGTNFTIQYCNCTIITPNLVLPNVFYCTPRQAAHCFLPPNSVTHNKTFLADAKTCLDTCPILCETLLYTPFAVYSKVDPRLDINSPIQKSIVNIYFANMEYTKFEEKPLMNMNSVVMGFGGNLGLFAGLSLITVVQFLINIIAAIPEAIKKK